MLSCSVKDPSDWPSHSVAPVRDNNCELPRQNSNAHANDRFRYTESNLVHSVRQAPRRSKDGHRRSTKELVYLERGSHHPQKCAVHRMPPEILGIIFENCLEESVPRAFLSEPPLLLGRVCSYWRSVSHNTHRLWTSLSMRFLETDIDRSRDSLKVAATVDTWLQRSYPAPLSIAFTDNRIFQKDTEGIVIWLLSRIRTHASRWKSIHLKFSSDYFVQLSVLSSCAFTSLTSFSVHVDHMGWRRGLISLNLNLTQASRLTSLGYTGPDHVNREDILIDWSHLTSIAFSYDLHESGGQTAILPRHFATLGHCQNLIELSIGLSTTAQHLHPLDAVAQGQVMIPMIELPRLHTLRVRRLSRSAHACALIDALYLPRLSTLDIDSALLVGWDGALTPLSHPDSPQSHTPTHWWHAHHFSALLDRSGCHLHTLHIRDVDMSPSELVRLLVSPNTSPTLSTFTFEPFPRAFPISDVLEHLVAFACPGLGPTLEKSVHVDPTSGSSLGSAVNIGPDANPSSIPSAIIPLFPCLTRLRLGCAHESHLDTLAGVIASRTGERAVQAGVQTLAFFELVFYDFVYSYGRGQQPWRKVCFDAFKERVLRCAREGGVDMDIRVERPYEPAYISIP